MNALLVAALAFALAGPVSAQDDTSLQSESSEQPVSSKDDAATPNYTAVGDSAIAPITLSDAAIYMQPAVQNFVASRSVKGIWTVKEKKQTWRLKLQEVVDDSAIKLGNRLFSISASFRTEKKPYHHVDIDFVVDFSKTPWGVKNYIVHEIDGKVVNPRPLPLPDPDDLLPSTTGPAAAASSKE